MLEYRNNNKFPGCHQTVQIPRLSVRRQTVSEGSKLKGKNVFQLVFISSKLMKTFKVGEIMSTLVNQHCLFISLVVTCVMPDNCELHLASPAWTRWCSQTEIVIHIDCKHFVSEHNAVMPAWPLDQFHVLAKCNSNLTDPLKRYFSFASLNHPWTCKLLLFVQMSSLLK